MDYENPTGYSQVVAEWRAEGDGPFQISRLYTYADDLRAESTLVEHAGVGAGGGGPPAHALVPGVQFPLRDALGTVRASVQGANALTGTAPGVTQYQYSAFGSPLDSALVASDSATRGSLTSQSAPSPWAFTGQRIDPATGLQYHRARWLDMALGRWASVDPVWDWPGNAGSGYQYCGSLPSNKFDPSGLASYSELVGVVRTVAQLVRISLQTPLGHGVGWGVYGGTSNALISGEDDGYAAAFLNGFVLGAIFGSVLKFIAIRMGAANVLGAGSTWASVLSFLFASLGVAAALLSVIFAGLSANAFMSGNYSQGLGYLMLALPGFSMIGVAQKARTVFPPRLVNHTGSPVDKARAIDELVENRQAYENSVILYNKLADFLGIPKSLPFDETLAVLRSERTAVEFVSAWRGAVYSNPTTGQLHVLIPENKHRVMIHELLHMGVYTQHPGGLGPTVGILHELSVATASTPETALATIGIICAMYGVSVYQGLAQSP